MMYIVHSCMYFYACHKDGYASPVASIDDNRIMTAMMLEFKSDNVRFYVYV